MSRDPATLPLPSRDSLELGSLASSSRSARTSTSSASSSRSGISSSRKLSLEAEQPLSGTREARPSIHSRSFSVSSAFDFTSALFPLSATANGGSYAPLGASVNGVNGQAGAVGGSLEKQKHLTYLTGLSLLIGLIIGSGIFSSPSQVNINAGSPGAALLVWVIAGMLAWTGASSYAELGGAIPLNGGSQVYLAKIFGDLFGFLFAWVAMLVLKPGSLAVISIIMGEYLVRAFIGAEAEHINPWINKAVALVGMSIMVFLNCVSTKLGTKSAVVFLFMKFSALLGITIMGIVVAATGLSASGKSSLEWKTRGWFEGTSTDASAWPIAIYAGLWAYDGWDNTSYIVGEFKNPSRDLPRSIHTAMPLVILSYLLTNMAYFFVLPQSTINASNTVAVMFGHQVFGSIGSLILALVVSGSCVGALNATIFTSSRLTYVAGKEGYIPALFGRLGLTSEDTSNTSVARSWYSRRIARLLGDDETGLFFTPINAMLLNASLTTGYILVGEFGTLVTFYGVAGYTFYFLTVLGLIVLRVREPNLERPYKTWITTPIIFCCVSLFLLSRSVFAEPMQTLIVVLFVASGVPVFYWRTRARDNVVKREGSGSVDTEWWRFWRRP